MKGIVKITGLIGTIGDEVGVELVDVISQVRRQPDATSFKVIINSEGGVLKTGFDIYNYLKALGLPIHTEGENLVASIATVVFMAGDTRTIKEGTKFLVHCPMYPEIFYANADDLDILSKELRKTEEEVISFYTKSINIQKEAILPLLRNETSLNREQLHDLGFLTTTETLQISARVKKEKNKNIMSKKAIDKKDVGGQILNLIKDFIGGKDTVNKLLYDADQNEVDFYELGEDEEVAVGSKAKINGQDAEGTITMADGTIVVFEAGVVTEITPVDAEVEETELEEAQARVQELEEENKTLTEAVARLTTEKKDAMQVINKIKVLQSKIAGGTPREVKRNPQTEAPKNNFTDAINKLKNR